MSEKKFSNGLHITYDRNSQTITSINFSSDILYGPAQTYYGNGQLETSVNYKDGKLHGKQYFYETTET